VWAGEKPRTFRKAPVWPNKSKYVAWQTKSGKRTKLVELGKTGQPGDNVWIRAKKWGGRQWGRRLPKTKIKEITKTPQIQAKPKGVKGRKDMTLKIKTKTIKKTKKEVGVH